MPLLLLLLKHNLDFEDAKELFIDGFWTVEDNRIDYAEKRVIGFGYIGIRPPVTVGRF